MDKAITVCPFSRWRRHKEPLQNFSKNKILKWWHPWLWERNFYGFQIFKVRFVIPSYCYVWWLSESFMFKKVTCTHKQHNIPLRPRFKPSCLDMVNHKIIVPHLPQMGAGEIAQSLASLSTKLAIRVRARLNPLVIERWNSITVLLTCSHAPVPTTGSKKAVHVLLCLCNNACKRSLHCKE